jgi:hypothetical protein
MQCQPSYARWLKHHKTASPAYGCGKIEGAEEALGWSCHAEAGQPPQVQGATAQPCLSSVQAWQPAGQANRAAPGAQSDSGP